MFSIALLSILVTLLQPTHQLPVSSSTSSTSTTSAGATFPTNFGYLGATATGPAPFLAQTDDVAQKTGTPTKAYTYPQPWESAQAYDHKESDQSIFELMGTLSPYYMSDGWGVYDYAVPDQCKIKQVHMLSRHGSRYPDSSSNAFDTLLKESGNFTASGNLSFLNDWSYKMGQSVLTTLGNQQLFDKGARSFFRYGGLYDFESEEKIVARSTTEERMTMTALYFLNGFFGLNWQNYVNLELQIESEGFNSSLASWEICTNNDYLYVIGDDIIDPMKEKYLQDAVDRFNDQLSGNLTISVDDAYNMQTLCAYETNNLGYSKFCSLFSQEEWEWYGYLQDIDYYYGDMFGNPNSRASGIGYVEELLQRLTYTQDTIFQAEQNSTIDTNPEYFPLNQTLFLDFTHDTMILNILTAMGMSQFKTNFTLEGPNNDTDAFKLSEVTPFAAQFFLEIIECDEEVPANRSTQAITNSNSTTYVHAVLNDHTLSLSRNIPDLCDSRVDGWCELEPFIEHLSQMYELSDYDYSCFGDVPEEIVSDGSPE